jgi:outer membrane lipoprotein-sorting protein
MLRPTAVVLLLCFRVPAAELVDPLPVDAIVHRMVQADDARLERLDHYIAQRKYTLVNTRFSKRAELTAKVSYRKPGDKSFEVLSESGSQIIRNRVLRRMLEAETDASKAGNRQQTRFLPANYEFRLLGMAELEGHPCYILDLNPRTENKYLVRGKAWVDASEFAVRRVEGSPAKNPSFWIRDTKIVQRYQKVGDFWLPLSNQSTTDVRIFGKTDVTIDYFDYRISGQ